MGLPIRAIEGGHERWHFTRVQRQALASSQGPCLPRAARPVVNYKKWHRNSLQCSAP